MKSGRASFIVRSTISLCLFSVVVPLMARAENGILPFLDSLESPEDLRTLSAEQLEMFESAAVGRLRDASMNQEDGKVGNCSDYFPAGSVSVSVFPDGNGFVSGEKAVFSGIITNDNPFPIQDVSVWVRISGLSGGTAYSGIAEAYSVSADTFAGPSGIRVPANGEHEFSIEWQVPESLVSGTYELSVSLLMAGRPVGGNPLSPIVGRIGGTTFSISGPGTVPESVTFVDGSVLVDGKDAYALARDTFLSFGKDQSVTVEAELRNNGFSTEDVVVRWETSDISGRVGVISSDGEEVLRLEPGESKRFAHVMSPSDSLGPVTRFQAVATSGSDSKSVLDTGIVRDGYDYVEIGPVGIVSEGDSDFGADEAFACIGAFHSALVEGISLSVSISDDSGKTVFSDAYDGGVFGSNSATRFPIEAVGFSSGNRYHMHMSLSRSGVVVDSREIDFACGELIPSRCLSDAADAGRTGATGSPGGSVFSLKGLLVVFFGLLAILGGVFLFVRHRKTGALIIVFFAVSAILFPASSASALQEKTWTSGTIGTNLLYKSASSWYLGISNMSVALTYGASMLDNATSAEITNGSSVPVGTVIRFTPKSFQNDDIQWTGDKYRLGFPLLIYIKPMLYGYWTANAGTPSNSDSCDFDNVAGVNIIPAFLSGFFWPVTFLYFVPLAVNPPDVSVQSVGSAPLSCSGLVCTVSGPGTVSANVVFAQTYGKFYYRWAELLTGFLGLCAGSSDPLRTSGSSTDYVMTVPEQKIPFSLTALSPSALRLCINNSELSSISLPYPGTAELSAYSDFGSGCSGNDVTTDTTFAKVSGADAVTLSSPNPPGTSPFIITTNDPDTGPGQQFLEEVISATYSGQSSNLSITVGETCLYDCSTQKSDYCSGEQFSITDSCGDVRTDVCEGTRNCNYNWREVAPGE